MVQVLPPHPYRGHNKDHDTMPSKNYDRAFLAGLSRAGLRRALWCVRRAQAYPNESNPVTAQYDRLATPGSVRAEYRRRGWPVPKSTKYERQP